MMITKICHIIADFFIKEKIISEEQRDVYEYGLELCVSTLIGVIITVVIGLLFNRFFETITFYIVFCFTRLFCGGFHAKCYLTCKITFICVLILVLLSDCLLSGIQDYFWIILYLFSLIVVTYRGTHVISMSEFEDLVNYDGWIALYTSAQDGYYVYD